MITAAVAATVASQSKGEAAAMFARNKLCLLSRITFDMGRSLCRGACLCGGFRAGEIKVNIGQATTKV